MTALERLATSLLLLGVAYTHCAAQVPDSTRVCHRVTLPPAGDTVRVMTLCAPLRWWRQIYAPLIARENARPTGLFSAAPP